MIRRDSRTVFVDSGYWVALELADDQHHQDAVRHWRAFGMRLPEIVITSFIFDEVVTFLNNKRQHSRAVRVGNRLLQSDFVEFVQVDSNLLAEGWQYFQQHQDKDYSLTDCISFVVMRKQGITTAFTFDRHFEQAGFLKQP
jgi:predicted nucleic acid-binding protein